jgi:Family of unknown function (DUF5681)
MSNPPGTADYAVGRGRPPLATRFEKGNTAARGRRQSREKKSFVTLLLEALEAPVVDVGADGRHRRLAKREVGLRRLADQVADGDPQAIKLVLGVVLALERRGPAGPEERPSWAPADKAVIENLRALLGTP